MYEVRVPLSGPTTKIVRKGNSRLTLVWIKIKQTLALTPRKKQGPLRLPSCYANAMWYLQTLEN